MSEPLTEPLVVPIDPVNPADRKKPFDYKHIDEFLDDPTIVARA